MNASPHTTESLVSAAMRDPWRCSPNGERGGLLTQAAVLSLTSDGTRHRPGSIAGCGCWSRSSATRHRRHPRMSRARYACGWRKEDHGARKAGTASRRSQLHRLHLKIDPLGVAFDNYDAIDQLAHRRNRARRHRRRIPRSTQAARWPTDGSSPTPANSSNCSSPTSINSPPPSPTNSPPTPCAAA